MLKLKTAVAACLALSVIAGLTACSSQPAKSDGDAKSSSSPSAASKTAVAAQIQTTDVPGSPSATSQSAENSFRRPIRSSAG